MSPRRMRSIPAITAAASLAIVPALAAVAAESPAQGAATTWVGTATRSQASFFVSKLDATRLGPTSTANTVHLAIGLQPRHQAAERRAMRAMYTRGSGHFHQFLTRRQFTSRYAPTATQVSAVGHYLARHGFHGVATDANRMVVTANGTIGQAEHAFHTSIANFAVNGHTLFANTSRAMVPQRLDGTVLSVIGLSNLRRPMPHPVTTAKAGSPDPFVILPPKKFRNTYEAAGTHTGRNTAIAVFTEGKLRQVYRDLRTAERKYDLPRVDISQVNVGPQSADTAGLDEWDMDTQTSTAMATNVRHLYMYNVGALTDNVIVPDFNKFVSQNKARALSASIGGCDIGPLLDGSLVTTDEIEVEGSMQGQTIFASSGDNGAGCMYGAAVGVPTVPTGTNWPASGAFTTAVGGTSLLVDKSGNRVKEVGWIGSGGGFSEVETPGWWTDQTDVGYQNQYVSGGRAVPDIALDADPNFFTAAAVVVHGAVEGVGGTSLSSPLMLGSWARLESRHHNRLGLASIDLYRLYNKVNPAVYSNGIVVAPNPNPKPVKGLTDIEVGDNGPYLARPGYDEVTGLGAPNVRQLERQLR
jgi:subtilase family serine protease